MSKFLNARLQSLEAYTPGEQPQVPNLLKLNTNECPYPPSPRVLAAIDEEKDYRLYPDPAAQRATSAVARYYDLAEDQVIVGNGSDEILAFIFMAYGERIYYPAISYGFYPVFAQVFGCEGHAVPLTEDLAIDPADYTEATGTVLIANPNAPTGRALAREELEALVAEQPERLVVIDEAYVDFGGESCVPLIDRYANLLVTQTMSKSRSLAGMRIGMAMGQAPLIEDLNRIRYSFNPYNLSREAIAAAAAAMEDTEYFERCTKAIARTREWFAEELSGLGIEVLPSKANFLFARTGEAFFHAMREKGIVLRHFDKEPIRDYVRITIGTREDMERLLAEARDWFADEKKG